MKNRFISLWHRINAQGNAELEYAKIYTKYTEPHRFYHNTTHIGNCLTELDSARDLAKQPDLVEFSIWYHDIIYSIEGADNEGQSAKFAYEVCSSAGLPKGFCDKVEKLILATKHDVIPNGFDARIILDVDMSILGKPSKEFDEYERKIRQEYEPVIKRVSEKDFQFERLKVLSSFLNRAMDHELYLTDFFRDKYEKQSIKNLQRSIEALK